MPSLRTLVCSLAFVAVAASGAAQAQEFLKPAQTKEAIRRIDGTCADTWCSGDFDYKFEQLHCSAKPKSCRLVFKMWDRSKPKTRHGVSCDAYKVARYADLVSGWDLTEPFYDQLNECIAKLEKSFGKSRPKPKHKKHGKG